ncbi:tRNA-splicing endonuclease subunit Sen15, partial [Geodia barretti]
MEQVKENSWLLNHPKLLEMQSYGLGNSAQIQAALLTYLDLTEVKLWGEVKVHSCQDLKIIYLTAREKEESPVRVVVPLPSTEPLSMEHSYSSLSRLHSATRREGESAEGRESAVSEEEEVQEGVTLALVGRDSSI